MEYILLFLLLLNSSLSITILFKKKFEETLILSVFSYILVMFLSGVVINLNTGFYTLLVINLLCLIYNIISIIKKKVSLKSQFFTFGFIAFCLSYMLILWIAYGRIANEWDEFSHWALVIKNMFTLGNFGLGEESTLMARTYLSGTSLFQLFCLKLSGTLNESMLYVGMDVIIVSTILPVLKFIKDRKNFLMYILFGCIIATPMLFYNDVYTTLYVDAILGLTFAYTIYSYYINYSEGLSKFNLINLSCSLCMLIFIKDFGLVLAIGAFLVILIDNLFVRNKFKFKTIWKNSKFLLLTIIPMIVVKVLWIIEIKINSVVSTSTSSIIAVMKEFITTGISEYQSTIISTYVKGLFDITLVNTHIPLSYLMCLGISIILSYFVIENAKEDKKAKKVSIVLCNLGAIAYAILLLFVPYLTLFSEYEAMNLASFSRYMNSYVLGLIFIEIVFIIQELSDNKRCLGKFTIVLFAVFVLGFSLNKFAPITINARSSAKATQENRAKYSVFKDLTDRYVQDDEKVYFIATNTKGAEFWITHYILTPKKMNIGNFGWSIGVPYYEGDIWTKYVTKEQWTEDLLNNYDYVYLYNVDEQFISLYGDLFYNDNIENNQLYKVNTSEEFDKILALIETK